MKRFAVIATRELIVLVGGVAFIFAGVVTFFWATLSPETYPLGEPARCDRAGYRLEETLGGGLACGAKIPKVNPVGPPEYCHLWRPAGDQESACSRVAPK